ncbi:MAG TPA: hypothetical protein VF688_14775 [Allosphingosinicella sp.]|jgi:hypothetical protein
MGKWIIGIAAAAAIGFGSAPAAAQDNGPAPAPAANVIQASEDAVGGSGSDGSSDGTVAVRPQAPGARFVQPGPQQAQAQPAPPGPVVLPGRPVGDALALVMIGLLALIGLIFLAIIFTRLSASGWSLAEALSENVVEPEFDSAGNPVMAGPVQATRSRMVPSTSRLIALMGLFAILLLYIGFGGAALYYFTTGQVLPPQIGEVKSFLYAGLTLFAPYIVSKFSSAFRGAR